MPGYGAVTIGAHGVGGASWSQAASLYLDFWVSALPTGIAAPNAGPIYKQYADATGHAPPLRENAMMFWQSRNRYKVQPLASTSVVAHYPHSFAAVAHYPHSLAVVAHYPHSFAVVAHYPHSLADFLAVL